MVLDFKLSLNIKHTDDGVTPAGPSILCATCVSWRFILTSDKDPFESLPALQTLLPVLMHDFPHLCSPIAMKGVTGQCPVPG